MATYICSVLLTISSLCDTLNTSFYKNKKAKKHIDNSKTDRDLFDGKSVTTRLCKHKKWLSHTSQAPYFCSTVTLPMLRQISVERAY